MNENLSPLWHACTDDEGQVSVYDARGFVAAVPDWPTACQLVAIHNAAVYRAAEDLHHERWAVDVNFECWKQVSLDLDVARAQLAVLAEENARLKSVATALEELWHIRRLCSGTPVDFREACNLLGMIQNIAARTVGATPASR